MNLSRGAIFHAAGAASGSPSAERTKCCAPGMGVKPRWREGGPLALRTGAQRTDLTFGSWERGRFGRRRNGERGWTGAATAAEAVAFQQKRGRPFQAAVGLAPVETFGRTTGACV